MGDASRLDTEERDRMRTTIDRLMLRHLTSNPCPLTVQQLASLYEAMMSERERTTWHAAREWWLETNERPPVKHKGLAGIPVILPYGERLILQLNGSTLEGEHYPMWSNIDPPPMIRAVDTPYVLGDAARDLHAWACTAINVHMQTLRTAGMAHDIIEMASTVGQLHRMCPDLVKYTYNSTREALERQQRRSPRPKEWANVCRSDLRLAMDHLALCYLLPESTQVNSTFEFCMTRDWIFCRSTVRTANGDIYPGSDGLKAMHNYDLASERFTP